MKWENCRKTFGLLALTGLFLVVAGCPEDVDEPVPDEEEEVDPVVDPDEAASIEGVIHFEGPVPERRSVDMDAEPECAAAYGEEGPLTVDVLVEDEKLQNVFVYVKEGLEEYDFPVAREPAVLDQIACRYTPRVLGMMAGQDLLIKNSDPLLHNINARPEANRPFNISQPREGMETTRTFQVPEVMIPIGCDVHGWMTAYVGVLEHPYHSVSGADGAVAIDNLPPGEYVIEAWHERYGTQTTTVTLEAQETAEISFTYSEEMAADADVPLGDPVILHRHRTAEASF